MWVISVPSLSQLQRNSTIKNPLFYQEYTYLEHNTDKCTPEKYCSLKYVRVLNMLKGKQKAHNFMLIILWPRAPHMPEQYVMTKTTWTYFCPECGTSLSSWPLPFLCNHGCMFAQLCSHLDCEDATSPHPSVTQPVASLHPHLPHSVPPWRCASSRSQSV